MPKNQATTTDTTTEPETARPPVFIDYAGKTGPLGEFDLEGSESFDRLDGDPLTLTPGLNIHDGDAWAAFEAMAIIKRRIADRSLTVTDEALTAYASAGARRRLAERTTSPDALEHLLELEKAKPQAGPVQGRRDAKIIEVCEKRLSRGYRPIDLSGVRLQQAAAG